jgi:hypothetical protein
MDSSVPSEDQCWLEFWEVLGRAAYRIWVTEQQAATDQATAGSASPIASASLMAA